MPPHARRMSLDEVMAALQAAGTAQNVKIYRRHGATGPLFGVSFAVMGKLARQLGRDHGLATALWETGNGDAMHLATMIADPAAMTDAEADRWLLGVRDYGAAGALSGVVGRSPVGRSRAEAWMRPAAEFTRTTGYDTLSVMLKLDAPLDAAWLTQVIATIEAEIGGSANRARHAMNQTLIAMGGYRAELRERVYAAAARIGRVEVDHGETGCVTPEIVPYIERMLARPTRSGAVRRSGR